VIGLTGWPSAARAVGNLKYGPVEFQPYFQIAEMYDSNVCRTPDAKCPDSSSMSGTKDGHDWVTIFTPGIKAALPFGDHRIEAEYRGDFGRYNNLTVQNYSDNTVKGAMDLHFAGGLSASIKNDWVDGHDPPGYSQTTFPAFYHSNTFGAGIGYEIGPKTRFRLDYTNLVLNYANNTIYGFEDRSDNVVAGTFYYKFWPKTSALLEYKYTATAFDEENVNLGSVDSKAQRGYLGLTWDITERTKGTLKGGFIQKNFKNSAISDYTGGIFSLALDQEMNSRTALHMEGIRDVNESNLPSQPYYITAGGRAELQRQVLSRLKGSLMGGYSRDQYPGTTTIGTVSKKRIDNLWDAGAGLEYRMREWLSFALGYKHTQRTSNFSGFNYIDNQVNFSAGTWF